MRSKRPTIFQGQHLLNDKDELLMFSHTCCSVQTANQQEQTSFPSKQRESGWGQRMPAVWRHKQCAVKPLCRSGIHVDESEQRQNTQQNLPLGHLHKNSTALSFSMLVASSFQSPLVLPKVHKGRLQYCWYGYSRSDASIKPKHPITITVFSFAALINVTFFACHSQPKQHTAAVKSLSHL